MFKNKNIFYFQNLPPLTPASTPQHHSLLNSPVIDFGDLNHILLIYLLDRCCWDSSWSIFFSLVYATVLKKNK